MGSPFPLQVFRIKALLVAAGAAIAVLTGACSAPVESAGPLQVKQLGGESEENGVGAGTVLEGDQDVKTTADLDKLRGVTAIHGNLTIVRTPLESLEGLDTLTEVKGLSIIGNANLHSLQGLNGLERVAGNVEVRENASLLDVDALARLTSVDGALQIGSDQVANWDPNAKKILGYTPENANDKLAVVRLPQLTHVRSLVLRRNPVLASLEVPRLTEIDGNLEIAFDPKLTTLQSLADNLTRIGGELILGRRQEEISYVTAPSGTEPGKKVLVAMVPPFANDTLAQVNFPKLRTVGALNLASNPALERAALPELTSVGGTLSVDANQKLSFFDVSKLRTMTGHFFLTSPYLFTVLCGLTTVSGDVAIAGAQRLQSLAFLSNLTTLEGSLELRDNPGIRDLQPLHGLRAVGGIDVTANKNLRSLAGLENVTRVRGSLSIMQNESLTSLDALASVTDVGEDLVVWDNDKVPSVTFPVLRRVGKSLDVNGGSAVTSFSFPLLASTGMFQLALIGDGLTTFSLPSLKDVHGTMYLLSGPRSLAGLGALERIDGDFNIMSETISREAMEAFVALVKSRRGIGGNVQLSPM